nr:hypothetical protein [Tanacetum cinerariifolium]GEX96505.1 hypothetical protein [Tanacetum cinerariifolium]GEY37697.1 hypothetical protein [Tanacetum cinerariifolium]
MERTFLSQKGSEVGIGVKEKQQADGSGYNSGNDGALSSGDATNTQLDVNVSGPTYVNGDGGARSLGNGGALSSGDVTYTQLPTANIAATNTRGNSAVNKEGNLHDENDGLTPSKSTSNPNKGISYANLFTGGLSTNAIDFHTLFTSAGKEIDVIVPVESVRAISERFANTAYGFFFRKHVAYPVVTNYVRNTWGKYGLVKSMLNSSTGIFSFQISSMVGLDAMLENGPWFIRNNSLILKKWNPDVNLLKEDVELKYNIAVAMAKLVWEGFYTCNVRVEYEWKPLRCACSKVFGHVRDECLKNIDSDLVKNIKKPSQIPKGVLIGPVTFALFVF